MILTLAAGPTMMDDTESYHIQMIKWLHEYGTVPGLANLHARYGFNSSWFSSVSFFLPTASSVNFYTSLNGLVSLWFCGYLINQLPFSYRQSSGEGNGSTAMGVFFIFLLSLVCWPLVRGNAVTANYDFITSFLTFVLFFETFQGSRNNGRFLFREEWIIWPVYLFTVRTINYPFLLLSLYSFCILLKEKRWQKTVAFSCIGITLLLPYIARNVLLSGYAFYPAKQLDFFGVDWKVEEQTVDALLHFIKYFNRVNTMFLDIDQTEALSFPAWIPVWFRYLFGYDKWVLLPGLAGMLLFLFKNPKPFRSPVNFFVFVAFLQLISWFLVAPDPRFVYGCLLIGAFLLVQVIVKNKTYIRHTIWKYGVAVPFAMIITFYTMAKLTRDENYQNPLLPYRLPQPAITPVTVEGIRLSVPGKVGTNWNPRCYATDLPCLYIVHPKLSARGQSVHDGFRIEK